MNIQNWLNKVAYKTTHDFGLGDEPNEIYQSKFDNSYVGMVGLEKNLQFLADREIIEQLTHGVGFSPKDGKWYGWSHRAIHGFKIGSTCKKGDYHYIESSLAEQEEDAIRFWQDEDHEDVKCKGIIQEADGTRFFTIEWKVSDRVANSSMRSKIRNTRHFITPLGRGEWIAETMEDAKQMAIDFNEGVS